MPSGTASASRSRKSGARWSTAASNPNSSTSARHFSGPPAIPTARAPLILAIWPTADPTGPVAAATTTVSPGCRLAEQQQPGVRREPGHAQHPERRRDGGGVRVEAPHARASATAWVCQPEYDSTRSPTARRGDRDSTHLAHGGADHHVAEPTGSAYDSASLIRPRM